jgi:endonuclease/exonuclease/phosphatase (EEP) superfamily protein YafD
MAGPGRQVFTGLLVPSSERWIFPARYARVHLTSRSSGLLFQPKSEEVTMLRSRSRTVLAALLVFALVMSWASVPALAAAPRPATLKVMTRNLYLGAELGPTFTVTSLEQLVAAVTQAFATVQATNFPQRAEALADEIADTDPHLVGLQEVELWRSQTPADANPAPNATDVEFDFLQLLLDALAARGHHYAPAAIVTNFDSEAPRATAASPTGLQDIRLTDRDVIIARTDLPGHVFSVSKPQAANFQTNLTISNPVFSFTVVRGWSAVDAAIKDHTVRVVNTHLERFSPQVQVAQGNEILAGPANTDLPVVLLGDLNSAAAEGGVPGESDTPTYDNMIAAGFADAWSQKRGDDAGFTCCHAEDLRNPVPTLTERIDFVLVRGGLRPSTAHRIGHKVEDRTSSGLWPSDHAGVWAVLKLR